MVFPTALALTPGAALWSVLFFAMLLALGIDSAFSMMEVRVPATNHNIAHSAFVAVAGLQAATLFEL